ncbi:hypothetical protein NSP_49700 [Nodularia spumigena CCY9414]|nr:hypothetical protein NSP_49700 [Nodularia spumigena CCY9414]
MREDGQDARPTIGNNLFSVVPQSQRLTFREILLIYWS